VVAVTEGRRTPRVFKPRKSWRKRLECGFREAEVTGKLWRRGSVKVVQVVLKIGCSSAAGEDDIFGGAEFRERIW
jgi:hypothetical protein